MPLELTSWVLPESLVLPFVDGMVPAGFPSPAEDYVETPLDLGAFLIENQAATFLMRVQGDSMRDDGIHDGSLLVVDRAATPVTGSRVVALVDGEYTVKRLRRGPDCVWLDAANPHYASIRVGGESELMIFGVVRHAIVSF